MTHPPSTPRCLLLVITLALTAALGCDDDGDDNAEQRSAARDDKADAGARDAGAAGGAAKPPVAGQKAPSANGQAVEIRFAAKVHDTAFECGRSYSGLGTPPRDATPVDFRFYVHDVQLVDAAGKAIAVELEQDRAWQYKNVALLDFEDGSGDCDQGDAATNTSIRGKVAPGSYRAVKFTLGIPRELNHADLSSQPSPLNKSSLFWGWNMGHIFFAATSRTQASGDDDAGTPPSHTAHRDVEDAGAEPQRDVNDHFTHVGSTGCDGNPTAGEPVKGCMRENRPLYELRDFDPDKNVIAVDFAAVKEGSDIAANPGCHSFTSETCATPFEHLGIDWGSGKTKPNAQTLYSVE